MSDPMVRRRCGLCAHHDATRRLCGLHLSYAAFVEAWHEAGDCPGYEDAERARAELMQQSQTRGAHYTGPYYKYITGVKP